MNRRGYSQNMISESHQHRWLRIRANILPTLDTSRIFSTLMVNDLIFFEIYNAY